MYRVRIAKGTQLRSSKNIYTCTCFWMLGNNITRYELIDKNGREIEADYEELHEKIEKNLLIKI